MQYYITRNNQQLGPFTEAEVRAQLASGAISPQDHVWWEGQEGWILLAQSPLMATTAPAIPGTAAAPAATAASYAGGAVPPTSKLAVWALICGCASILLGIFTSIPAIILGHMGLSEIRKNPALQGRGMAKAGLILGYIFTLILPVIAIIAISVLIALGNQVKETFKTINSQIAEANAAQATNSADQSATNSDQSTNAPDQSTNAPDQSTNSAPASTNSPDQTTTSAPAMNAPDASATNAPSTNAPDTTTNAAPMSQ